MVSTIRSCMASLAIGYLSHSRAANIPLLRRRSRTFASAESSNNDRVDSYNFVQDVGLREDEASVWARLLQNAAGSLTDMPTVAPVRTPVVNDPTLSPTRSPTQPPTISPTPIPTPILTSVPSDGPTNQPTTQPKGLPTSPPTDQPTHLPSPSPIDQSTSIPSPFPTDQPTRIPTMFPSHTPTVPPSPTPTARPSMAPTVSPTETPTLAPTGTPSMAPTPVPTSTPEDCTANGVCNENCSFLDPDPDCPTDSPGEVQCNSVVSTFEEGDEGWTITGDAQGGSVDASYSFDGGNPGGHIFAVDDVAGGVWRFRAPQKYHGDFSAAYGYDLIFDLRQSDTTNQFSSRDVIIEGGGSLIWFDTPNNPDSTWTSYVIPLEEGAGWRRNNNDEATEADIRNVLSSIEDIQIRGEYRTGEDIGRLDNFVLQVFCEPTLPPTGSEAELLDVFLVDANSGSIMRPLINGQIIELESFPGNIALSILADADDISTASVDWVLSNVETNEVILTSTDDTIPYTLGNELNGGILPVAQLLQEGRYSIEAIPRNADGVAGASLMRTFSIVTLFNGGTGNNKGREFWVVELPNLEVLPITTVPGNFGIAIVNARRRVAEVEIIHIESQSTQTVTVPVGEAEILDFPRRGFESSGITTRPTYRILSDTEVVVHAFSPLVNVRSNDAALILPTSGLGKSYLVPTYASPTENFVGTVYAAVATEDDTLVQVFNTVGEIVDNERLTAGQTLQRLELFDLSGYRIVADKPIAVFAGSRCTAAGSSSEFCDILYEQVIPEQALGMTYLSCPTLTRPIDCSGSTCAPDIFRYMATEDNTSIDYAGLSTSFDAGQVLEFESNEPHLVSSSRPIYAYQVLISQRSEPNVPQTGDPAILAIPPVEQFQFAYLFFTPSTFVNNFVNVMAPNGMILTIDGVGQTIDCISNVAGTIKDVDFCCQAFQVGEGVHEIEGTEPFGIYATGFDQFTSYAYTGGLGLQPLASGCNTGGPYRVASCEIPSSTILSGTASCSDGSTPRTFWSTPELTIRFNDVIDALTVVSLDAYGTFTICLDVVCGSSTSQCCSSIEVLQRSSDGDACN